ncbi:MAG: hypothetical protein ACYTAF_01930 [Planctomycetota bacterium]|jgi:hypothetical protein
MAKHCLNHSDRAAVTMCRKCHRPVCASCVTATPLGSFCSSECSALFREFRDHFGAASQAGSKGKVVILAVLILFAAVFGIHFLARGIPFLRTVDLLGPVVGYPDEDVRRLP